MRNASLIVNAIVVIFFGSFLAYTYVGRAHVAGKCRDYALEKTAEYSAPLMGVADKALNAPLVDRIVPERMLEEARLSVEEYKADPSSYIARVIAQAAGAAVESDNPILKKLTAANAKAKAYFDETVDALISDLRLFSLSNLMAGLAALLMAYKSPRRIRAQLVWFSCLMCGAVVYSSYLYVDDMTFFRILTRAHMGWWYPILLCIMIVMLIRDFGHLARGPVDRERAVDYHKASR